MAKKAKRIRWELSQKEPNQPFCHAPFYLRGVDEIIQKCFNKYVLSRYRFPWRKVRELQRSAGGTSPIPHFQSEGLENTTRGEKTHRGIRFEYGAANGVRRVESHLDAG